MKNLCLIRRGHLGDVLLTEPVARHFRRQYDQVFLATNYPQVQLLLHATYSGFIPYTELESCTIPFDQVIHLEYEPYPHLSYIEGYACAAGITLENAFPLVHRDWPDIIGEPYLLLAPGTSRWMQAMRNWGDDNFESLRQRLEAHSGLRAVVLNERYGFTEMLSLIRHCRLFIGNDSGPGIIAQCFGTPALIIFGGTDPDKVLFSPAATALYHPLYDCIGCKQRSRHTEIACASPLCLTELGVDTVFGSAMERLAFMAQE